MDITIPNDDVCITYHHTYLHLSLAYQPSSSLHSNIQLVTSVAIKIYILVKAISRVREKKRIVCKCDIVASTESTSPPGVHDAGLVMAHLLRG